MLIFWLHKTTMVAKWREKRRSLPDVLLRNIETNLEGENDQFILATLSLRHLCMGHIQVTTGRNKQRKKNRHKILKLGRKAWVRGIDFHSEDDRNNRMG